MLREFIGFHQGLQFKCKTLRRPIRIAPLMYIQFRGCRTKVPTPKKYYFFPFGNMIMLSLHIFEQFNENADRECLQSIEFGT